MERSKRTQIMKLHFFLFSRIRGLLTKKDERKNLIISSKVRGDSVFSTGEVSMCRTGKLFLRRRRTSLNSCDKHRIERVAQPPVFSLLISPFAIFRYSFSLQESSQHLVRFSRRFFVDAPVDSAPPTLDFGPGTGGTSTLASSSSLVSDADYVYPLDAAAQKITVYGELNSYSVDDSHRVISSNRLHSYDPSILSAELRLQDNWDGMPMEEKEDVGAGKDGGKIENDAVMREGRNKQGAAGAAAVAAAVLESRRAVDGIALIPGHPLPVVFPRPDDLPPPLRFIKKFGPGGGRQTTSKGKRRPVKEDNPAEDEEDKGIYSEVLESDARVESHSFQKSFAFHVRVLDEHHRPTKVKGFHHFSDLNQSLPVEVQEGFSRANFSTPTLMQSVVMPLLLLNKDIICVAPPTSGCSFAIAIRALTVLYNYLSSEFSLRERASGCTAPIIMVICPTAEVVQRVSAAFRIIAGKEIEILRLVGGKDASKEEEQLRQGKCHILISTPKLLSQTLSSQSIQLDQVQFIAGVEVDKILKLKSDTTSIEMKNDSTNHNTADSSRIRASTSIDHSCKTGIPEGSAELENIFRVVHDKADHAQSSLWCHSLTNEVQEFAGKYLSCTNVNIVKVQKEEKIRANVRHILYALKQNERLDCIWKLYDSHAILKREQVLIFCLFKETAEYVAKELTKLLSAPSSIVRFLHRGVRTNRQQKIMKDFERGDCRILVTTDAVAKKLDVPDLEHIINYDLAPSVEVLSRRLHQVGQSGRTTMIHTFLVPEDSAVPLTAKFISEQTGKPLSPEIMQLVQQSESSGIGDTWSTPVIRFRDQHWRGFRWRVSGTARYGSRFSKTASGVVEEHLGRRREAPAALKAKEASN